MLSLSFLSSFSLSLPLPLVLTRLFTAYTPGNWSCVLAEIPALTDSYTWPATVSLFAAAGAFLLVIIIIAVMGVKMSEMNEISNSGVVATMTMFL